MKFEVRNPEGNRAYALCMFAEDAAVLLAANDGGTVFYDGHKVYDCAFDPDPGESYSQAAAEMNNRVHS